MQQSSGLTAPVTRPWPEHWNRLVPRQTPDETTWIKSSISLSLSDQNYHSRACQPIRAGARMSDTLRSGSKRARVAETEKKNIYIYTLTSIATSLNTSCIHACTCTYDCKQIKHHCKRNLAAPMSIYTRANDDVSTLTHNLLRWHLSDLRNWIQAAFKENSHREIFEKYLEKKKILMQQASRLCVWGLVRVRWRTCLWVDSHSFQASCY